MFLVEIPLDDVKDSWLSEWGPLHKRALAEHYGVYRDLFSDAFFVPVIDMKVLYDYDDEFVTPVHSGNVILPSEVSIKSVISSAGFLFFGVKCSVNQSPTIGRMNYIIIKCNTFCNMLMYGRG